MNYLGHFVYNHSICRLEPRPYFVLGVVLPDLWPRFSRRRRIHWKTVRESIVTDPITRELREGLLNHVDVDRRFHHLPSFIRWQRELKQRVRCKEIHSALLDFLAHLTLELVLDHYLVSACPHIAEELYNRLASCDPAHAEELVGIVGKVDSRGLGAEIQGFINRRYLPRFATRETLSEVIAYVLTLMNIRQRPSRELIQNLLDLSLDMADPETVWTELSLSGQPTDKSARTLSK